jgi:hypothetical protein
MYGKRYPTWVAWCVYISDKTYTVTRVQYEHGRTRADRPIQEFYTHTITYRLTLRTIASRHHALLENNVATIYVCANKEQSGIVERQRSMVFCRKKHLALAITIALLHQQWGTYVRNPLTTPSNKWRIH